MSGNYYVFDPVTGQSRKLVGGVESAPDLLTVGGSIEVRDEGSTVLAAATIFDFIGAGVTVTDGGGGKANVTITSGSSGSVGGVGAANQIAVWSATTTLTGDGGLTFDLTEKRAFVGSSTFYKSRLTLNFDNETDANFYGLVVTGELDGSATTQSGILVAATVGVDTNNVLGYLSFIELAAGVDVQNTYAFWIYDTFKNAGATLDTQYGIFVLDLTSAINNYVWWSGLGEAHFGDTVEIDANLEVTGATVFNTVSYTWPGADGTPTYVLTTDGAGVLSWAAPTGAGSDAIAYNYLANGGGDFFQRQDPATLTSKSDDTYAGDRWYVLTQTAAIQTQRTTGDTHSTNAHRLKQNQASAQRMGYAQIVESLNSIPFRSKGARFQARIKCSGSQPIRVALLEWTGTADAVTSDVVNDWTSGVYTSGSFFISPNLTVTAVAAVTPGAATWTDISVSGTLGASVSNVIVMIWTEGTAAQNVTLDITEAGLYIGSTTAVWSPRLTQQEANLCQRFYSKSFNLDINPVQNSASDTGTLTYRVAVAGATTHDTPLIFPVRMRVAPTLTYYNPSATNNKWRNIDLAVDSGSPTTSNSISERGVVLANPQVIGDLAGHRCEIHWSAEAEL